MHPVDLVAARVPVLISDFFRHQHKKHKLSVFLCGRAPNDPHFDLRKQVGRLLKNRMGCDAFLGEDIQELQKPHPHHDHLTIEVKEAVRSDLIVMFLGSPGTIAELTAFAMDHRINPKVIVFNDQRFKDAISFINLGPMKLLPADRVIYYDAADESPSTELVLHLDAIVTARRYQLSEVGAQFEPALTFESFALLALIHASYPVRYRELSDLFPWDESKLRTALAQLFALQVVDKTEEKFVPITPLKDLPFPKGMVSDIARARMALLDRRLRDPGTIADYRLLV